MSDETGSHLLHEQDPRPLVFRVLLGLVLVGTMLFAASYLVSGRPHLITYLLPYGVPAAAAYLALRRWSVAQVAEPLLYYFLVLTVALRFTCEPDYPVDFINLPTYVSGAAFLLQPRRALAYSLTFLAGLVLASLLVFLFKPFPLLFVQDELPYGLWIAAALSGLSLSLAAYHLSIESTRRLEGLRMARREVQTLNTEYRNLLSVLIHDFANDALGAKLALDSLEVEAPYRRSKERAEAAVWNLQQLILNLRRLKKSIGVKPTAEAMPFPLADLFARLTLTFSDALAERRLAFTLEDETGAVGMVEPLTFSVHVMGNLLGNAIRNATGAEPIVLRVETGASRLRIRLSNLAACTDHEGLRGILSGAAPPAEHGEGQGLGLAIVRTFCRKFGYGFDAEVAPVRPGLVRVTVTVLVPEAGPLADDRNGDAPRLAATGS